MAKCPNCKENYTISKSDNKRYPFVATHSNTMCPFGIESYQRTRYMAKKSINEHIRKSFPWLEKAQFVHLKRNYLFKVNGKFN